VAVRRDGEQALSRITIFILVIAEIFLVSIGSARAETYPSRSIRVIVPFAAGGGIDVIARILQPKMQEILGQPLVIQNRPGAAGVIGTDLVAKAAPDGYTLLFTLTPHIVNAYTYQKLPYDPLRDFAPVSMIATTPNVLAINPDVRATSVRELIDLAKAQPGVLNYGTAGIGSAFHLAGALFAFMAGVNIVDVPYEIGGPQAVAGVLSGQVQIIFANFLTLLPYIQNGQVRALAVTSSKRLALMPELPTIAESGVPGYEFETWFGALAPTGVAPDKIQQVYTALKQTIESSEVERLVKAQGAELAGTTPQQFANFLDEEMAKWGPVIRQRGFVPKTEQ
jgi:tripartite-type tricarboxylate transporter receptor subunit TctC